MEQLISDWKTSLLGLASAVTSWAALIGQHMPQNKMEWAAAALAAIQLIVGYVLRDPR